MTWDRAYPPSLLHQPQRLAQLVHDLRDEHFGLGEAPGVKRVVVLPPEEGEATLVAARHLSVVKGPLAPFGVCLAPSGLGHRKARQEASDVGAGQSLDDLWNKVAHHRQRE